MSLSPLYLFLSAWLLGFAEGHGCLEVGVLIATQDRRAEPTQQGCEEWCAAEEACIAWTYDTDRNLCWQHVIQDCPNGGCSNSPWGSDNPWVTGTKTCDNDGNIPSCINIVMTLLFAKLGP